MTDKCEPLRVMKRIVEGLGKPIDILENQLQLINQVQENIQGYAYSNVNYERLQISNSSYLLGEAKKNMIKTLEEEIRYCESRM